MNNETNLNKRLSYQKRKSSYNKKNIDKNKLIRSKQRKRKRLIKKRRKKIIKSILFFLIFLLIALFLIYKLINHFFFEFSFNNLPNLRDETNHILTENVVISDTKNRELTIAEKKSDFNKAYELILENYPKNKDNENLYEEFISKKQIFEEKIIQSKNDEDFYKILYTYLSILKDDKTNILFKEKYKENLNLARKEYYKDNSPYLRVLENDKVVERYKRMDESPIKGNENDNSLTLKKINNKIAYIGIKKMDIANKENDHDKIINFLKSLKTQNNLIIDLRDGSGNSDSYWVDNLVKPISQITYTSQAYLLFSNKKTNEYMDYLSIEENIDFFDLSDERYEIKNFEKINKETYPDMLYCKSMSYSISSNNESNYNGNIYILQNENTTDTAENFSYFAKQSNFALVCGRASSGKGLDIKPFLFKLDHSGLILSIDVTKTLDNEFRNFNKVGNIAKLSLEEPLYNNLIKEIEDK